jgi:hypothetical protein
VTRIEFERREAMVRFKTVSELRALGFWSVKCEEPDKCEWQCIAIPPSATRRETQAALLPFKRPRDLEPKRFGEA